VTDERRHPVSRVDVASAAGAYPVLIGRGLLRDIPSLLSEFAPAFRYAVVSDAHVAALYGEGLVERCRGAGLRADLFAFPRGEASKTRKHWSILTDQLLQVGVGRDAAVVAVGGGVTGDLAGFVASTYLRGIPVVQVPTSLVAMIDASVGGKTGVDVRAGKNLVGSFHPPEVVIADPEATATLETAERAQGLVEAIKHGAILDEAYFEGLRSEAAPLLAGDPDATRTAVLRSVEIKASVVAQDEHEGGLRQVLNFGHTLGHAVEAASGYAMGHGSAVAAGMVLEAELGESLGLTDTGTSERLAEALGTLGVGGSVRVPGGAERVLSYLGADKKSLGGRPRFFLLNRVGSVQDDGGWTNEVPASEVERLVTARVGEAGT
jgi:3-dehydroquinate synthase